VIETVLVTVAKRPYVFVFLAAFLFASWTSLGKWRTALFLVVGYLVAFASEYSSIRNDFPYGRYWYVYDALDPRELVVGGRPPAGAPVGTAAGVPFFDSLSYVFLAYASYELALFFAAPTFVRGRWDLQLADTGGVRRSWSAWALATFFMGLIDVIVDPVAFLGDRWFLGKIYGYGEKDAPYFHVPFSNFAGWWLVAGVTFAIVLLVDAKLVAQDAARDRAGRRRLRCRALVGPGIWLGVAAFNTAIAFSIGAADVGFANLYIAGTVAVLVIARGAGVGGRATKEEVEAFEAESVRD
jgi:putative membrane protein